MSILVVGSGQSNAVGGGGSEGGDLTINEHVFAWSGTAWEVAVPGQPPFYEQEPGMMPRNSIFWNACKDLQQQTGEDVYLVLSGEGSTPISAWNQTDGEQWLALNGAVQTATASLGKTVADYFLWFQGESDARNEHYREDFLALRQAAIDAGWLLDDTRIVVGEMSPDRSPKAAFLEMMASGDFEWLHMAVNRGIPTAGFHFTGQGCVRFGERFLSAMFEDDNNLSMMRGCDHFVFGTRADDRLNVRGDTLAIGSEGDDIFLIREVGNAVIRGGDGYDKLHVWDDSPHSKDLSGPVEFRVDGHEITVRGVEEIIFHIN